MTVTVPLRDTANYEKQQQITAVQALITANVNPLSTPAHKRTLRELQMQLVQNLIGTGAIPASAVLSGLVYGQADTNT